VYECGRQASKHQDGYDAEARSYYTMPASAHFLRTFFDSLTVRSATLRPLT
jgi:hypothetical protein